MQVRNVFLIMPILMILAVVMVACGGDDEAPCDTPVTITPGIWCITIQSTLNTCNDPLDNTPYWANFTQNVNSLSAVSEFNHTYTGKICGADATMTGNNEGIATSMDIMFTNTGNASGSVVWSYPGCSGTDTFIAIAGDCVM